MKRDFLCSVAMTLRLVWVVERSGLYGSGEITGKIGPTGVTTGFERVLQFCTVGSASVNPLGAAANPSLECSCTEAPCENLEKSSKNGLPSGTSRPFLKIQTEIRRLKNRR